jgi:hypothetical protein
MTGLACDISLTQRSLHLFIVQKNAVIQYNKAK